MIGWRLLLYRTFNVFQLIVLVLRPIAQLTQTRSSDKGYETGFKSRVSMSIREKRPSFVSVLNDF